MSLHVEWLRADAMNTEVVPAGSQIGEDVVDYGHLGLILHYDEAVVVEGRRDDLRRMLKGALEKLERVEVDSPIPGDYEPDPQ